jgi:ribosomal protein L37AE/L43A
MEVTSIRGFKMNKVFKYTTEQFVEIANKIHCNKYSYAEASYKGTMVKLIVTCSEHGNFLVTPNAHCMSVKNTGCPACKFKNLGIRSSDTLESWSEKANNFHNYLYDYTKVVYSKSQQKVIIICPLHGDFLQSPHTHLRSGCNKCGDIAVGNSKRHTKEKFVKKANLIHNNIYDYSQVIYTNSQIGVNITCKIHGIFNMKPNNHTSNSQGCPQCASTGFKPFSSGILYLMQCGDITKIGITNVKLNIRLRDVSTSFGSDFTILKTWNFKQGSIANDLETKFLKSLRQQYQQPIAKFDGSTECFLSVDVQKLIAEINEEVKNK